MSPMTEKMPRFDALARLEPVDLRDCWKNEATDFTRWLAREENTQLLGDTIGDEANDGPEYLHISLDIDVMDPAYTSGTGTPVPGGLTPREVFYIVRGLCSENNVVGFDLVELNPLVDPGYTTVLNAKKVVDECMTGIALRKLGLGNRDYLSPLTRGDGRR